MRRLFIPLLFLTLLLVTVNVNANPILPVTELDALYFNASAQEADYLVGYSDSVDVEVIICANQFCMPIMQGYPGSKFQIFSLGGGAGYKFEYELANANLEEPICSGTPYTFQIVSTTSQAVLFSSTTTYKNCASDCFDPDHCPNDSTHTPFEPD